MRYQAVLAHVYSSGDSYQSSTGVRTLTGFRPSGTPGDVSVQVGRAPRWLFRARGRLFAINPLAGGNLSAWLAGTALVPPFRLRRGELSRPWYTTLLLRLPPLEIDVGLWDEAIEHESVLREAAVLLASQSTANVIEELELRGLFLQGVTGDWVKCPEFRVFDPAVHVGHPEALLLSELPAAERTLHRLKIGTTKAPRLIEWAHQALLTSEPWSQFVWLMFSLEQLTQAHYQWMSVAHREAVRASAESHVSAVVASPSLNWQRPSITMRFAAIAEHLTPTTAAADTASFYGIRAIRDELLHGQRLDAPDGATRQTARALSLAYSRLVSLSTARP